MIEINKLLNFALPPLSLIVIFIFTPPLLLVKLLMCVKKFLYTENVAGKVVLITGAASGIGEVWLTSYFIRLSLSLRKFIKVICSYNTTL